VVVVAKKEKFDLKPFHVRRSCFHNRNHSDNAFLVVLKYIFRFSFEGRVLKFVRVKMIGVIF
jgi:hypothetical protein